MPEKPNRAVCPSGAQRFAAKYRDRWQVLRSQWADRKQTVPESKPANENCPKCHWTGHTASGRCGFC